MARLFLSASLVGGDFADQSKSPVNGLRNGERRAERAGRLRRCTERPVRVD